MKVRFWGVRGSTPTPFRENLRYGGNTSCVEVRTPGDELFIFDCGTGLRQLGKSLVEEYGHRSIHALIFLSHYHWDHIHGIPFVEPLYNPENYFFFHSFPSHAQSVQAALEEQMSDPYFPVDMGAMAAHRHFYDLCNDALAYGDATLRTAQLNHPQGCLGYRLECNGQTLVYATDNEPGEPACDRRLRELADGADVLIYDGQYTPLEYVNSKKGWGHSTWREAVNVAKDARVKNLVLFHHDPDHNDAFIDSIVHEASRYFPNVSAASEGMELDLLTGGVRFGRFPGERRLDNRHPVNLPLVVHGRTREGLHFEEHTTLENISLKGGYFLLKHDPDPRDEINVHLRVSPEMGGPLGEMSLKSHVVRLDADPQDELERKGVAVTFQ
jgi:phosphoribosyl 1,2-cyclic phosphodiesterase